ncbi:MAG: hypothetical protein ACI8RD_012910, partial [Bacillariaceae sp.]
LYFVVGFLKKKLMAMWLELGLIDSMDSNSIPTSNRYSLLFRLSYNLRPQWRRRRQHQNHKHHSHMCCYVIFHHKITNSKFDKNNILMRRDEVHKFERKCQISPTPPEKTTINTSSVPIRLIQRSLRV